MPVLLLVGGALALVPTAFIDGISRFGAETAGAKGPSLFRAPVARMADDPNMDLLAKYEAYKRSMRDDTLSDLTAENGRQMKSMTPAPTETLGERIARLQREALPAPMAVPDDATRDQTPATIRADLTPTGDSPRIQWWDQTDNYSEEQRKERRTIFMHDDWVRHRSSERFFRNLRTLPSSGINQALSKELTFVTSVSLFVVLFNMLLVGYQDLGGVAHPGPLSSLSGATLKSLSLPALPFSILMPALSLLLVFRTNTAYSRWNEARTLWGGLINNCRNIVRQGNTFFPDDPRHNLLKRRLAVETASFIKALRNFLRGPSDDETLRSELYEYVKQGLMTPEQLQQTMAASNRPMFCLSAMSATLRKADIDPMHAARIDSTISVPHM